MMSGANFKFGKAVWNAAKKSQRLVTSTAAETLCAALARLRKSIGRHEDLWPRVRSLSSSVAVQRRFDHLEELYESGRPVGEYVPTGFEELDDMLGGWQKGTLSVIGGRPAMGKTSFLLQSAVQATLDAGHNAAFVTTDLSRTECVYRALCSRASVEYQNLMRGRLTEEDWERLILAASEFTDSRLFWSAGSTRVERIIEECRRLQEREGVEVVFIDFLQKLRPRRRHESYSVEVGKACARLKEFAVDSGMAVVTTAQLNRSCERRDDKRPVLADLRSSGLIEELADLVLLLYRDEVYYPDTKRKGIAEVCVAKNWTGPIGTVHLRFDAPLMRFDVTRPELSWI